MDKSTNYLKLKVKEPMVNGPTVKEPMVNGPTVKEPMVNGPTVKEPMVNGPTVNGQTVKEPMVSGGYKLTKELTDKKITGNAVKSDIAQKIEKCRTLTDCKDLVDNNCGYCWYTNKFQYGDQNGPDSRCVPKKWMGSSRQQGILLLR